MTACDGHSFNVFTTSLDIRRSISALGHSIPKSVSGARDQVVKYGQQFDELILCMCSPFVDPPSHLSVSFT